ncbi:MAG: phosphate signaling complex protein PhoU [bacterium]|nr:phosphate signaling complex protein PhoU [bacterium]
MDKYFNEGLKNVKENILQIASIVEDSIIKALDALKTVDVEKAKTIREIDRKIDKMEIALEEQCIELIARHQPVGSDLRFLIGAIKMNNDLERMGDHAVNISDCVNSLAEQTNISSISTIWSMADAAIKMLKESVDSFIYNDPVKAQKVCEQDDIVDEMKNDTIRLLLSRMIEEPKKIGAATQYALVARNLERIADLATNISEDVIYIAQARVIKHHAEEMAKEEPNASA